MSRQPEFYWDEEARIAQCEIQDEKGRCFIGTATCHEEDLDMMNKMTGYEIAYRRAKIESIVGIRDLDIKPALAVLKQHYYSMAHSSQFNPKSYEAKMLFKHIRSLEFDLTTIKEMLAYERQDLKDYINEKDAFYKKVRAKRQGQKQQINT